MRNQLNTKKLYNYDNLLKLKTEGYISNDDFEYIEEFGKDKLFKLERFFTGSKMYTIYELSNDMKYKENTYRYINLDLVK